MESTDASRLSIHSSASCRSAVSPLAASPTLCRIIAASNSCSGLLAGDISYTFHPVHAHPPAAWYQHMAATLGALALRPPIHVSPAAGTGKLDPASWPAQCRIHACHSPSSCLLSTAVEQYGQRAQ